MLIKIDSGIKDQNSKDYHLSRFFLGLSFTPFFLNPLPPSAVPGDEEEGCHKQHLASFPLCSPFPLSHRDVGHIYFTSTICPMEHLCSLCYGYLLALVLGSIPISFPPPVPLGIPTAVCTCLIPQRTWTAFWQHWFTHTQYSNFHCTTSSWLLSVRFRSWHFLEDTLVFHHNIRIILLLQYLLQW